MEDSLYDLLDQAEVETVIYSEHDNPHSLLGPQVTDKGVVISAFIPTAVQMKVRLTKNGQEYPMSLIEQEGFFSVLLPGNKIIPYTFKITYDNNTTEEIVDPYSFEPMIDPMELTRFTNGIHYTVYDILGAHLMETDGVKGVLFAVWAPNAVRVSVAGDFNNWDGRRHPMRRLYDSGIFELFIPGLKSGEIYKYEIKIKGGLVVLKADPYANRTELRPNNASVVCDLKEYEWQDRNWLKARAEYRCGSSPLNVYEVHLGSWKKPPIEEGREFYNYRELAPMLAGYVKDMGYTHIELLPVMEHPFDGSWGYQLTGYYAPTARYGSPADFMYFMDYMHSQGIGVVLDWVPAHFPRDTFGLANFDGTCLYEHKDPKQGAHPHWGTLIYNYGRTQVSNFLLANALFWVEKYHADGIRMDAVASMLYLDYGKKDGEWIANIYGGNENLEAIELLKHLNSIFKKREDGALLIAEESTSWPKITGDVKDGGLGFDLKWNLGWMNDFTNYMKCDPLFRKGRHGELTFSMIYAYSEKFMLVFSHDEVVHGKGSMINKMPGTEEHKFANLRAAYGLMMCHPGKKLLFMGQDFAQPAEWNEAKSLDWDLLDIGLHEKLNRYVKELNKLYRSHPALYELDYEESGFEWVSCMDADHSIIAFTRKSGNDEILLAICNFTPVIYRNFQLGVPFAGKYKEIFNSDRKIYGGYGNINPRLKQSKNIVTDGREDSISLVVPPLGITVLTCTPVNAEENSFQSQGAARESQ
jgi:1,4-alpha-glucan branching enzyme